jgi:hypothetical protein
VLTERTMLIAQSLFMDRVYAIDNQGGKWVLSEELHYPNNYWNILKIDIPDAQYAKALQFYMMLLGYQFKDRNARPQSH